MKTLLIPVLVIALLAGLLLAALTYATRPPAAGLEIHLNSKLLRRMPRDDFDWLFVRLCVGSIARIPEVRKGLPGLSEDA